MYEVAMTITMDGDEVATMDVHMLGNDHYAFADWDRQSGVANDGKTAIRIILPYPVSANRYWRVFRSRVYRINPDYYYDGTSVSTCAWRHKQWFETEGVIIAVGQGVGKREGMLGRLVVQITLYDGRQVRLSVGGGKELTNTQLTKMWLDRDKLLGMMATIKYQELSIHSTPLRAQLVCIRNYE